MLFAVFISEFYIEFLFVFVVYSFHLLHLPHIFLEWLAAVYRDPLSVQAAAVTVRVCLSPHAVCPVHVPPGKFK